jgi:hypothetical protein
MLEALEIVRGSSILTSDDFRNLSVLKDELRQTWETVQIYRTRTEMEVSILNDMKRPTPDAKYWQAVREQNVMFVELVNLSYEYRKKAVEIRKLQRDLAVEEDELERELKQIEIEQNEWYLKNMERMAHDRIREILEWSAIKTELLPHLKYGDEDVNAHQLEAMEKGFNVQAKLVNENTPVADARNIIGLADMSNKLAKQILGDKNVRKIK